MCDSNQETNDKTLELLRFNYENLHEAVWGDHKTYWTMTNIFIPIIFGSLAYMLKELDTLCKPTVVIGCTVIAGVAWFWYLVTRILAKYNYARFQQLRKIEKVFDDCYSKEIKDKVQFIQYERGMKPERCMKHGRWMKLYLRLCFWHVTFGLTLFLTAVSAIIAVTKIVFL